MEQKKQLKMNGHRIPIGRTMRLWLMTILFSFVGGLKVSADDWPSYITDVVVIGGSAGVIESQASYFTSQGYYIIRYDLNAGAGGDYIYLGYKKGNRASTDGGYITDLVISNNTNHPETATFGGVTYHLAPYSGGEWFNKVHGNLNSGCGKGWDIFLYYTRHNFTDKRVLTDLSVDNSSRNAVGWNGNGSGDPADVNRGIGDSKYVYIHQFTGTKTNRPKSDVVFNSSKDYDCTELKLIKTAPTVESGTMYYRVNNGSWTSDANSLKAKAPGTYTVNYYVGSNSYGNSSETKSQTIYINKGDDYPGLKSFTIDNSNSYSRSVTLAWDPSFTSNTKTTGKWYLFRNGVKIDEVAYKSTKTTYTEILPSSEYGKKQNYAVCFAPDSWYLTDYKDAICGYKELSFTMNRSFSFENFTVKENVKGGKSCVTLNWNHSGILDASGSSVYTMTIQRASAPKPGKEPEWIDLDNIEIKSTKTVSGSYDDVSTLLPNHTYLYRLKIYVEDNYVYSSNTPIRLNGSTITGFSATRGNYNNAVKLQWTVNQVGNAITHFTIQRRPLGSIKESDWADIYTTSGTASSYSYEDLTAQPGSFNEYRVLLKELDGDNELSVSGSQITDGFSISTGVVSGRVSFGSGTAVQNVKITMRASNADGDTENSFRSLKLISDGSGIQCLTDASKLSELVSGNFSTQMFLKPSNYTGGMTTNGSKYVVLNIKDIFEILLKYDSSNLRYQLGVKVNGTESWTNDSLRANDWSHMSMVYENGKVKFYVINPQGDIKAASAISATPNWKAKGSTDKLTLGNNSALSETNIFRGQVDEFRFFSKAITEDDIKQNYNHTLSGAENDLAIYWPMDEGIENGQPMAYDFSKKNGISNGNHGKMSRSAQSMTDVPSEDQLSLMTYTDENGNYTIRGIGFSGEGTNYVITPTMGIHRFSPTNKSRFFSLNSLVHSGVDFEDVSSFPVSGVVYYENTTIPVADAYIKVDGITAARDGKAVTTNENGAFSVDVPIGEHFISVEKNGHVFANNGRYPEDPDNVGARHNFDDAMSGLTFYDQTLVTVVGRVAGGDIEYQKPLGVGMGNANIGKAKLTLDYVGNEKASINAVRVVKGTSVSYETSKDTRDFETTYGSAYVQGGKNSITIETDGLTGEFVAQLPPLNYIVKSVQIPSNEKISFKSLPTIDATNPLLVYADSVETTSGLKKCEYVGSAKIEYKNQSKFVVTENEDGSFGIKDYNVKDVNGDDHKVAIYTKKDDGSINYAFGYPVYEELGSYVYHLRAYEEYENRDNSEEIAIDYVPLAGSKVSIKNQFASTTSVLLNGGLHEVQDDSFELDSLGEAEYQFTVGYPNIQAPYTRGLSISYDNAGTEMSWEGNNNFKAIVLGGLPTGNNFVTQGPDEILMVLRDPPGTGSSATWSKGTTVTTMKSRTVEPHSNTDINTTIYAGVEQSTAEGIGFMVIQDLESKVNITAGAEVNASFSNMKNKTTSVTTTRDISTSDGFDFNGADGDVFIGSAKNIIFGACHSVDIRWNNQTGMPELNMDEALATGEEFTTGFAYTQNYIKGVLIPNFESLRNNLLTKVDNINNVKRPEAGNDPIYVTTLSDSDPHFGTSNNDAAAWGTEAVPFSQLANGKYVGPSYTMILPADYEKHDYQDMVNFYNLQIAKWQNELKKNEEAKVTAIENRSKWLKENHSFDAGTTITLSVTNDTTTSRLNTEVQEVNAIIGAETGARFSGVGIGVEITETIGVTTTEEQQRDEQTTLTTTYSLVEDGDDDYLSVDVFNAPDGFGPIFYTRAGATSCPYEDEVVTEFYKPGTVIMQKTVQIEKPEIEAATEVLTGVPAGGKASFQVYLRNNSDTKEDGWYDINVVSDSNPDGLVVKMDGLNVTSGRAVLVKAGETMTKTFTVEQSNPDVLTYENVKIRIASQCQKDNTGVYPEIADTTSISVYFQPTCSDVKLTSTHTLVNNDTETTQKLSISGYNYSMTSLKAIRLQCKSEGDADFSTLQEYTKDADRLASDKNLLPLPALEGTKTLDYMIDMRSDKFADKTYTFRAITVCMQGGEEVNNESEEITIVRDMTRPMLIATPTPASGILGSGDDLTITFNENIQGSILSKANNFDVVGELNESEVSHDVALSLTGNSVAKTQSTMSLAGKSFSTSMWVNYSTDGRLLMHGTNDNHFTVAIENGKLVVAVNGQKAESKVTIPANKWIYLNVSYNAENNTVNAGYAQDASTVTLINNADLPAYDGNGPVSVGGNDLTAKVQELSIWNDSRSMAQAQADMYTTKSQFTSGLIGYWQLNEGHGNVATDKARSRNMTLPSTNAWWINGDNFALTLDGTKAAAANIGALNTTSSEDYLVEAWFKADETQNGVASILSTQVMDLRLNAKGELELALTNGSAAANSSLYTVHSSLNDGQWHHVAINVLKSSNGSGIIYVDGQQCKQLASSAMPALYGDKLLLGAHRTSVDGQGLYTYDQMLKGAIDEVRIWKGRRTADVIKNNMYNRVKANEAGLVAYYPLEYFYLDQYNQVVSSATFTEQTAEKNAEELSFFTSGNALTSGSASKDNTAALKQARKMENVEFSFVASERQIKVDLSELPAKLEGCNIYITAKNVKDVHGNIADPITWSVFVQQNRLNWTEPEQSVVKTGSDEVQFTATIENSGSETETWSLSGLPEWLTVNEDGGTLSAQSKKALTFTVAGGLPIGTYDATVYVTGAQGIHAPLNIVAASEGDAPNWVATTGENTMTIIGQLKIDKVISSDTKDMVAAFRGTECVGVAHPKYFASYDAYFVMLSIYGKENAALTFKAYDASTGQIYPSVSVSNKSANTFVADKTLGKFGEPVVFTPLNEIEQSLTVDHAGWKWFSLYAKPKDPSAAVVFADAKDDISAITDGTQTIIDWGASMTLNNYASMYKLNAVKAFEESFVGEPVNPGSVNISLAANSWTWIGYPVQATNSLAAAFASAEPLEGDMVKNQSSFSVYTGSEWLGTLTAMQPGDGYAYLSNATKEKTFNFPTPKVSGKKNVVRKASAKLSAVNYQLKDNMTMIAVVMDGDKMVEDAEVSVYAGAELRGLSTAAISNGKHFITIGGENAEVLTYVVKTAEGEYQLQQADIFQKDMAKGSVAQPYVLQLSEATGISLINSGMAIKGIQLIDNGGRVVAHNTKKLYTKSDLKSLPAGVYYQQVTFQNGQSFVQKLMK